MRFLSVSVIRLLIIGILMIGCRQQGSYEKPDFVPTTFKSDTSNFQIRQIIANPLTDNFVAIFFKESSMSFGSGNKLMKLYSRDSLSIDECYYGSHPLVIKEWSDSSLIIECGVFSAHGDSAYRKWYLDNSVDKNNKIGNYRIDYKKYYNYSDFNSRNESKNIENRNLLEFLNKPIDLTEFKEKKGTSNSSTTNRKPYHFKPDTIDDFVFYWYLAFPADSSSERLISPTRILVNKYGTRKNEWDDKNEILTELKVFGKDSDLKSADLCGIKISDLLAKFGDSYKSIDNYYYYNSENKILIIKEADKLVESYRYLRLNTDEIDSILISEIIRNE